jgi:GNAT superfamily N-acetyltransferase
MEALIQRVWPAFVIESYWPKDFAMPPDWYGVYTRWPHFQFALLDAQDDSLVAAGNFLALAWDDDAKQLPDDGWNWVMYQAKQDYLAGKTPTIASALSITVDPARRGQNLSRTMVSAMRDLARQAGFRRLIAPVRPTWKPRYPLTPMTEFIRWTTAEGLPLDPWMRVHARLGARVIKPCERSMILTGTVAEWEQWLNLPLPSSGVYVGPGLLSTLEVDKEADLGVSVEPNVWMEHPLD